MNQDNLQQGLHLTFYCHVRARHEGMLVSQWLLEQARRDGLGGGSVFRATAGFGRHGQECEKLQRIAGFELVGLGRRKRKMGKNCDVIGNHSYTF